MTPVVGIIMGSDSDWPTMEAAALALAEFEVPFEVGVVSAHRTVRKMVDYAESAADPEKRRAMDQVMTLLNGVLDARGRVLLKLNVSEENRDRLLAVLPSMKSPTISLLANGGYAVETVVEKRSINLIIPEIIDAGATDLLELPISKIVP